MGKTSRTNEFVEALVLLDGRFYFRIKESSASTRRPNVENQCNSTMFWTNLTF